jgi:hypothetical protein
MQDGILAPLVLTNAPSTGLLKSFCMLVYFNKKNHMFLLEIKQFGFAFVPESLDRKYYIYENRIIIEIEIENMKETAHKSFV